jgi:hypothetical protein
VYPTGECARDPVHRSASKSRSPKSISPKYPGGAVFGLQPTLFLFMIFFIKAIEKVKNVGDMLRQEYRTERRSGAKVAL